jgi:hypothetical protein
MLLSSLILALLPLTLGKLSRCLHSGSERQINEAFAKGGKGAVVSLCQGSVHRLNQSIAFTAGRQTLTTEGEPKGRERAMLIVEGENLATAIKYVPLLYAPTGAGAGVAYRDLELMIVPIVIHVHMPLSNPSSSMVTDRSCCVYRKVMH